MWAFDPQLVHQKFYQIVRGTDDVGKSIGLLLAIGAGYAAVLGVPILIARLVPGSAKNRALLSGAVLALVAMSLGALHDWIDWQEIGRPLALTSTAAFFVLLIRIAKPQATGGDCARVTRIVFATFAALLLLKIPLHVVLYHYGFVLAAPALMITVVAFVGWIPRWIDARGGCGAIARYGAIGAVLATSIAYLSHASDHFYGHQKLATVGAGADGFYTDSRGGEINQTLDAISATPKDATLAVVPQGAMINFLSRRENPTPFVVLMPPELIMFGEDPILAEYQKHPPDLLVILGTNLGEYGYKSFPQYAPKLAAWIDASYRVVTRGGSKDQPWSVWRRRT